ARGLGGLDDQKLDLAQPELVVGLIGVEPEYLLNDGQDALGDNRGEVGSFFDATTKHAVEGLGVEPALTQLRFEEQSSHHECHLQSQNPACTLGHSPGRQVAQYGHSE